jgi:hypothetical protein
MKGRRRERDHKIKTSNTQKYIYVVMRAEEDSLAMTLSSYSCIRVYRPEASGLGRAEIVHAVNASSTFWGVELD